jgi:hypothetical protein
MDGGAMSADAVRKHRRAIVCHTLLRLGDSISDIVVWVTVVFSGQDPRLSAWLLVLLLLPGLIVSIGDVMFPAKDELGVAHKLVNLLLNLTSLRILTEGWKSYAQGQPTTKFVILRTAIGLLSSLPQSVIQLGLLLRSICSADFSFELDDYFLPVSVLFSLTAASQNISEFEIAFSPHAISTLRVWGIRAFFVCDAALRCLICAASMLLFAPGSRWVLFSASYSLRSLALFAIYAHRKSIFHGIEMPATNWLHWFLFALVPGGKLLVCLCGSLARCLKLTRLHDQFAGLLQVMSDYPFNDELGRSGWLFAALFTMSTFVEPSYVWLLYLLSAPVEFDIRTCSAIKYAAIATVSLIFCKSVLFMAVYWPQKAYLRKYTALVVPHNPVEPKNSAITEGGAATSKADLHPYHISSQKIKKTQTKSSFLMESTLQFSELIQQLNKAEAR